MLSEKKLRALEAQFKDHRAFEAGSAFDRIGFARAIEAATLRNAARSLGRECRRKSFLSVDRAIVTQFLLSEATRARGERSKT